MKKYKAIRQGFNGIKVCEVGEVFEFGGKPGTWMQEISPKGEAHVEKHAPAKEPEKKSEGKTHKDEK